MATVAEKMTAIGDAIRAKTDSTEKLTLDQMARMIMEITSPNGTAWTNSITPTGNGDTYNIQYANNIWVCTGQDGVRYSRDGKTWYLGHPGTSYGLCYANGIWVAGSIGNKGLFYSEDGIAWKQTNITSESSYSIYYANNLWVASCINYGIYYSTDGKTWTVSNISRGNTGRCVYYANNLWICDKWYSTDGINWTQCTGITTGLFSAYYNNNIWVAIATNGILYYSTDGMEWTSADVNNLSYGTVYYANNLWVAAGYIGIYYSSDGITWSKTSVPSNFRSVYYDNNMWIATTATRGSFWCSRNGITWMQVTSNINAIDEAVYFANNMWATGHCYSLA